MGVKAVVPRIIKQYLLKEQVNLYSNLGEKHGMPCRLGTAFAMSGITVGDETNYKLYVYSKINCGLGLVCFAFIFISRTSKLETWMGFSKQTNSTL